MKISLLTLGCKVNQAEMSDIEGSVQSLGHEIVGLSGNPEICIVNTCAVTSRSDYQSRQLIRRAGRTGAKVIVTGCYAELNKDSVNGMDGVQAVISNADKPSIINTIACNSECNKLSYKRGRTRYFLKVQDGCNNSCSYCIVPRARGASRSISPEKVLDKINIAVDGGYREVVLTGIHLGQYGVDLDGETLSGLVENILKKTKVERLRLSSLEVNELDDRLLELFEDLRLARHLHIPLQSGDDEVLRAMNRRYSAGYFRDTLLRIIQRWPGLALGTDIIAGFPTESRGAFERTVALAESLPFTYMHVFPFSRRPGTPAACFGDLVGDAARKERASDLRALAHRKKSAYLELQVGRVLDVLIEERIAPDMCRGTTGNYLKVRLLGQAGEEGSIVHVGITGLSDGELTSDTVITL